jgi:hypothetical protein
LAGSDAREKQSLFETGYILGRFVSDAGDGIGVVKKFLSTVGPDARGWRLSFGANACRPFQMSVADVVDDLKNLAFHDASYTIQKRAALALDFAGIFRLASQPENNSYER